MHVSTMRKNIKLFADTIEVVAGSANLADIDKVIEAAELAAPAIDALSAVVDKIESETEVLRTVNRLSARIFKMFDYTCRVCGHRDTSCSTLSRNRLVAYPKKDSDYITLCKIHKIEFNELLPWRSRTDINKVLDVLDGMIDRYQNM